jgi:hypothetical protein
VPHLTLKVSPSTCFRNPNRLPFRRRLQPAPLQAGYHSRAKDSGLTSGEVRRGQYPTRRAATLNKSQSQPAVVTTITIDNTVRLKRLRMRYCPQYLCFALFSNTSHSSIFRKLGEERRAQTKKRPKAAENFSEFKRAETKFPSDDVRRRRRRNERKGRVWKLLPDRKIFRRDSEPSESQHVSARFSHSPGLCPGDLIDGQSFPLPPSPDDLRYSSLLSFRFPQCISLRSVNVRSMSRIKARSTPMRACISGPRGSCPF